ncbi:MAG: hypothetical protein HOK12_08070 [Candidatus Marinimicrobia bacterium]|nr:hypothetical protein [Candidatus Neomarinimicrobiota bacterium]MBT4752992.1 hypothetical protein [Candidatus Neomarinimicrobiota bacterium]MBT5759489.1 hypothetical protein [Candidatus Neomarinimicrobiota bacterium]MBT6414303.1 hypothetical protein [Candidatus Neomarinimicrobiota bacterium]MBT6797922.1 hypothetical protein [Candidatus Neomarinimicrobiota bacterium]
MLGHNGFDAQKRHVHDVRDGLTTFFENRYHTHICSELGGHLFTPEIQYYNEFN